MASEWMGPAVLALDDGAIAFGILAVGASVFGIVSVIVVSVNATLRAKYREQTKREVAAYVAEGTISPQDAQAILAAGGDSEVSKSIADALAWGTIKPRDAESLLRAAQQGHKPAAP